MSIINVTNVQVLNNPALFTSPLQFTITFECLKNLPEEIDWKLIYIGSSNDNSYDQELESFSMGPLEFGIMQFDLEVAAPDPKKIPKGELLGVTAIILSTSYKGKEFFRIGYYVYNNYLDPVLLENPPESIKLEAVYRNIFVDKPRITRFSLDWGEKTEKNDKSAFSGAVLDSNITEKSTNFEAIKDQSQIKSLGQQTAAQFSVEKPEENPFFNVSMEVESDELSKSFSFF